MSILQETPNVWKQVLHSELQYLHWLVLDHFPYGFIQHLTKSWYRRKCVNNITNQCVKHIIRKLHTTTIIHVSRRHRFSEGNTFMRPMASWLPRRRMPKPIWLQSASSRFPMCFCLCKRFLRDFFSLGPIRYQSWLYKCCRR